MMPRVETTIRAHGEFRHGDIPMIGSRDVTDAVRYLFELADALRDDPNGATIPEEQRAAIRALAEMVGYEGWC